MRELIEIYQNPRTESKISMSESELRAILGSKKTKSRRRGKKKEDKKKKKPRKRREKVRWQELAMGAVAGAGIEAYIIRNPDMKERIPQQARRYSGAIMAAIGYMGATQKKGKARMKAMAAGLMCSGIYIAITDEVAARRLDQEIEAMQDKLKQVAADITGGAVSGIGAYPQAPYMTAAQAASALGMQPQMPYQPHGALGDLVEMEGMGELMMGAAPYDPADNPQLSGLGDIVPSDPDGWLDGQFVSAGDDWRSEGWG